MVSVLMSEKKMFTNALAGRTDLFMVDTALIETLRSWERVDLVADFCSKESKKKKYKTEDFRETMPKLGGFSSLILTERPVWKEAHGRWWEKKRESHEELWSLARADWEMTAPFVASSAKAMREKHMEHMDKDCSNLPVTKHAGNETDQIEGLHGMTDYIYHILSSLASVERVTGLALWKRLHAGESEVKRQKKQAAERRKKGDKDAWTRMRGATRTGSTTDGFRTNTVARCTSGYLRRNSRRSSERRRVQRSLPTTAHR